MISKEGFFLFVWFLLFLSSLVADKQVETNERTERIPQQMLEEKVLFLMSEK
jgi:hypothetical protein